MLLTIAIILVILWSLGLVTHIAGGLIHLILVTAVVMLVLHFVRRPGMTSNYDTGSSRLTHPAIPAPRGAYPPKL